MRDKVLSFKLKPQDVPIVRNLVREFLKLKGYKFYEKEKNSGKKSSRT